MFSLSTFLFGLMAVAIGVLTLKFNYQVVGFTGHIDAIERHLGSGSTYFVLKLVSILIIVIGLLYAVGLGDDALGWLLSPLRNALPTPRS